MSSCLFLVRMNLSCCVSRNGEFDQKVVSLNKIIGVAAPLAD